MSINKNVLMSIIFIGIIGCLFTAGTWACSTQSNTPVDTKSVWLVVDGVAASTKCSNTIVPGTQIYNIYPTSIYRDMHVFKIQNKGDHKGKLYVQFIPTTQTLGKTSGIVVKLDNVILYSNGINKASSPVYIGTVPAATKKNYGSIKSDLKYMFPDNGKNQDSWEYKTLKFNLVFTLK